MMRLAILGSTGSIGRSALSVVDAHPEVAFIAAAGSVVIDAGGWPLDRAAMAPVLVVVQDDFLVQAVETAHCSFRCAD